MSQLVLIRHGESQWNLENRFTGWVDVPLSPKGEQEARNAGKKLHAFQFDCAFTSVLMRAKETLRLVTGYELIEFICLENEKDLTHMNK